MKIEVCFTPNDFDAEKYHDYEAVVIDVLRATTSIATACANGCRCVMPVSSVEEARAIKFQNPDVLLAGEREGLLISGFNLGNSPYEYSKEQVAGKTIVMTTTNGTVALNKVATAPKIYTMSFANAAAIIRALQQAKKDTIIVCAGSEGKFSLEDTLCAGLAVERLQHIAELSDTAMAVQAMYRDFSGNLLKRVLQSSHAAYLCHIGFKNDVDLCLQQDTLDVAPVFAAGVISLSDD